MLTGSSIIAAREDVLVLKVERDGKRDDSFAQTASQPTADRETSRTTGTSSPCSPTARS